MQEGGEDTLFQPNYDEVGILLLQSECEGLLQVSVRLDDSYPALQATASCT